MARESKLAVLQWKVNSRVVSEHRPAVGPEMREVKVVDQRDASKMAEVVFDWS